MQKVAHEGMTVTASGSAGMVGNVKKGKDRVLNLTFLSSASGEGVNARSKSRVLSVVLKSGRIDTCTSCFCAKLIKLAVEVFGTSNYISFRIPIQKSAPSSK